MVVGRLTIRIHEMVKVFDVYKAMKFPAIYEELSAIIFINVETTSKYVESLYLLKNLLIRKDIERDDEA